jgi:hypothetical protein
MRKILLLLSLCIVMIPGMAQGQTYGSVTYKDRRETGPEAIDPVYSKWRFSIDLAFAYRTGRTISTGDQMLDDFVEGMRYGIAYGADIHYIVSEGFGYGLRFSGHSYSNTGPGIKDVLNNFYIAPSFIWCHSTKNGKGVWVLGASIGYISYNEKASYGREHISLSKGDIGSTVDAGYDMKLTNSDALLGFRLTLFEGAARINSEYSENLSAIMLGVGLRF